MQRNPAYELSSVELEKSKLHERYAKLALRDYMKGKYGYSEKQYLVLSDEPEPELVARDDEGEGGYPEIRSVYSGYRLATIDIGGRRHYVKYSPVGDRDRYSFGGIDDVELEALVGDCSAAVAKLLARLAPERIVVNPGARLSNRALALDSRYFGQSFFDPIPSDGIFNLQVVFGRLPEGASEAIDAVVPFFDSCGSEVLVDLMYRDDSASDGSPVALSHRYWHRRIP